MCGEKCQDIFFVKLAPTCTQSTQSKGLKICAKMVIEVPPALGHFH